MRSLNTGFSEMCALVKDFDFDVFGVTETWLHPDTPSDNYAIPGYTMVRYDRQRNAHSRDSGGGVAMYIKEDLVYEQYSLTESLDPGIEHVCIVLRIKGRRVGVCVVYRPPLVRYSCLSPLLHSLFVELAIEVNSVVCLGDTNVDLLSKTSNEAKYLRRLLRENNANQLISEPTRVTRNTATLIDHIIVNRSAEVERNGVIDASKITDHREINITDHKLIYCTLKWGKENPEQKLITYRDFSKFNHQIAVNDLAELDWKSISKLSSVDEIEQIITENIRKVYDKHAPIVTKKVTKKKAAWKTAEIKALSIEKRKLRNKFWKHKTADDWENYKVVRNTLNKMVWNAKREFFANKLTYEKNPKKFWECIKQSEISLKSRNNDSLPPSFEPDNVNKYFAEMGSDIAIDNDIMNIFWENKRDELTHCQTFTTVTENDVKMVMNEIKSKAVGSDGISIQMIKAASPFAIGAITHLINKSLESGVFPKAWKLSIVRPLPKVPTPATVEQLRPISILPAMSKILEKLVIRQIMNYVDRAKILPNLQSGFRKNHSTCTALTNLMSDMIDAKDRGRLSSLVLLDYSKAFDSMHHDMLLAKMHYYGFHDRMVQWVRSYLNCRLQVTRVGSETSGQIVKERGVPQGSCLGPILYNLYTADFPECLQNCTAHLYADDSQLHITYEPHLMGSAIDQLNSDLDSVVKWSVANGLKLNVNKCTVLHTVPQHLVQALRESGVEVVLSGQGLSVCDRVKTLGLVLDSGLTFSDHVTHSIQRAVGRLRGLYRFKNMLPEHAKLQLMQSLILSAFYYCYPVYGNSISRVDSERIQKLQNAAIRFIFNLRKFDHVSAHRVAINMMPMEAMCELLTGCMIHKVLSLKEPQYLSDRLMFRDEVSQRASRHGAMLHFPRVERELGRRSFSYFGPALYNGLPNSLKDTCSLYSFKSKMKDHLKSQLN